jgi:hypothetical protein
MVENEGGVSPESSFEKNRPGLPLAELACRLGIVLCKAPL